MSGQVFISYRREESRWSAGRLFDRLAQRFDRKQLFMDVDAIPIGEDFVETIKKRVGKCDVLIAVIGDRWLNSTDRQGRRLDNPEDFVRTEIATALRRKIRVIPVLVDGASMPESADLPDDLKPLARRNALRISDTGFDDDCRRLVVAIEEVVEKTAADRSQRNEKKRLKHKLTARTAEEHPWVNSLGMKFVSIAGAQVLFAVWDTRVQDFEAFVLTTSYDATADMLSLGEGFGEGSWEKSGATWKEPGFSQGATHPVVGVSWNDAQEFCKWLTKCERKAGNLPKDTEYRLPTDEEWSAAVGLKNEEGNTPEEKSGKIKLYPWDFPVEQNIRWPPPAGAGNYAGVEAKDAVWPSGWSAIEGYNDGFPRTSPVGSFKANLNGLYDMGGNVWQWCEDWDNAQARYRVLRGASWCNSVPDTLLASFRNSVTPTRRVQNIGFRCVVASTLSDKLIGDQVQSKRSVS
jgi:formylglycine-generating enzyme required for sulfatase activity